MLCLYFVVPTKKNIFSLIKRCKSALVKLDKKKKFVVDSHIMSYAVK